MARAASSGAGGGERVITTVRVPTAVTFLTAVSRNPQPPASLRDLAMEKTTSCAVTGLPLENSAPGRRLKVYLRPFFEMVQLVARSGSSPVPVALGCSSLL